MSPWHRFWEKVIVQPTGCWEWTALRDKDGYGWFGFRFPGSEKYMSGTCFRMREP